MIESQSESLLPPPLKIRGARGVMKLDQGFAEEKRMVPGPGRDKIQDFRKDKGQPGNEAGLKTRFTEEKCFQ